MVSWNDKVKRMLKSELVRRGITNAELVILLNGIGINETKASIDSKISRGSFSACFFIQCLTVIGCSKIEIEEIHSSLLVTDKPNIKYNTILSNGE
jgi:hypothetical protein